MNAPRQCWPVLLILAMAAGPASAASPPTGSKSPLDVRLLAAARDAETMAVNSGQPANSTVLEITKAVRDVVWSSGEPPSQIVKSLQTLDRSKFSPQAQQAVSMVEQEMKE